jgi:tripartite-type tricarboxylate transporter receptor subunit TctC
MALATVPAFISLTVTGARAQPAPAWPTKPVRLVVPLPPGGAADIVARVVAGKLTESIGQQVVVENRPGAGTNIGPAFVAKSPADGYTLLLASVTNHAVSVNVFASPGYDLAKSFAPVALLANAPHILVAHPSLGVKTLPEFVAAAKRQPGRIDHASAGVGSPHHVSMELLERATGIAVTHIPYKGATQALADVAGGTVPVMMTATSVALPFIRDGRLVALAVPTEQRSALLPNVPTFAEAGVNFRFSTWVGMYAPKGTPRPIIDTLAQANQKVLAAADMQEFLRKAGAEAVTASSPERATQFIQAELKRWAPIVRETGGE